MTRILLIILTIGLFSCKAKKEFTYQFCVQKKAKPGHIISNQMTAIADTVVAFVSGQIIDFEKEPISFPNISFKNLSNNQVSDALTDFDGNFKIFLPAGQYKMEVNYFTYNSIVIDSLILQTGQVQEIKINLGSPNRNVEYLFKSKKPFTATQKKEYQLYLQEH